MTYHDEEWGVRPESDERWFEFIVLETFQAGLSWRTILHKRTAFREAFRGFSIPVVAAFTPEDVTRLLEDARIVRNRRKIMAAIENARRALNLVEQYGSLSQYFDLFNNKSDKQVLSHLQSTFAAVGRVTAESIAFATGLLPAPHDTECFKYRGQDVPFK